MDSRNAPPVLLAEIALPLALDHAYTYAVPPGLVLAAGDCVKVPLGSRDMHGIVLAIRPFEVGRDKAESLKSILKREDFPPLPEALLRFLARIAAYTLAPLGMVIKMAMGDPEGEAHEPMKFGLRVTGQVPARLTPTRARVLDAAAGGIAFRKGDLAARAACSTGVLDALVDEGALEIVPLTPDGEAHHPNPDHAVPMLNPDQREVVDALLNAREDAGFNVHLLEGVTGSGKTEVYFEAVAAALLAGKQVLILLPEIALTPEFLARFEARFGVKPGAWHSGIAQGRRNRLWHRIAEGEARVVVGARSALFLPFANLGLIIVDEEHEAAYKQEEQVRYHARDMAVLRAQVEGIPIILASATPSIESKVNAAQGRYRHHLLPDRAGGRAMPDLAAIDMRLHAPERGMFLSPKVIAEARETLARGEQVLFFLNRRGYAPVTLCRACGQRAQCPNCDAALVEHRYRRALICHHCGHTEKRGMSCTTCTAEDSLVSCGPGIERITEELAHVLPDYPRIALSSDMPGGAERMRAELARVAAGDVPVLIGTQLIAKGHNFPHLTLAVVVDADIGLISSDPRAAERTFQLMTQVTGRAGRGEKPGRGLLQSYAPEHPVIRALLSGDQARFYAEEIAARDAAMMPPFGRLAMLTVSAKEKPAAEAYIRRLAQLGHALLQQGDWQKITLLGPAESPMAYLRGKHRLRIILKSPRIVPLQPFIRVLIAEAGTPKGGARLDVDIDPMSFM